MEEHQEELATIESIDSGAVYTLALKTHVGMSIQTFRYFAGWCDKIQVELQDSALETTFLGVSVLSGTGLDWTTTLGSMTAGAPSQPHTLNNDCCLSQGKTIPINQARPNRNLTFTKREPLG